ncbi:DUF6097 family protein [Saccharibacillus kuerlensis]|uniref:SMODS and SLOG-associating 2TM effector domain-containing protein n=1 Tax=Saccharibacillus kuerlensis TaxID=459527 RepID=A0ABQ2KSV9_9BACL|nr:DUF6097 family protein [Saccharibacillus kuerlensis]GGN91817.1 hypothetical protein GCM10010969_03660 [Saccharibacillus kuerlensis]
MSLMRQAVLGPRESRMVSSHLSAAQRLIDYYLLPVEKEYSSFRKQMIHLERYAGEVGFERAAGRLRIADYGLSGLSLLVLLAVFGTAGLDLVWPALGVHEAVLNGITGNLEAVLLATAALLMLFVALMGVRRSLQNELDHHLVLLWQRVLEVVNPALDMPAGSPYELSEALNEWMNRQTTRDEQAYTDSFF